MFLSPKKQLQRVLGVVDDMLAGEPEPAQAAPHPHDRTVSLRVERRAGAVAPRGLRCLSPVRSAPPAGRRALARDLTR